MGLLGDALADAEPIPAKPVPAAERPTLLERPALAVPVEHDLGRAHPNVPVAERLRELAAAAEGLNFDVYGQGASLQFFEESVAKLLGKESACFFATGTAAQHAAILALAPQAAKPSLLLHPSSHLIHLDCLRDGPAQAAAVAATAAANACDFAVRCFGDMERVASLEDVRAALAMGAADVLVLEVPMRMHGGGTMPLGELRQASQLCRAAGVRLHMDGARLWEALPAFPGEDAASLAALFDTVYVSFYKGLGAMGCAMLAADARVIGAARAWQKRRGGDLFTRGPLALDCQVRLRAVLEMDHNVVEAANSAFRRSSDLVTGQAASALLAARAATPEGVTPERAAIAAAFGARRARLRRFAELVTAEAATAAAAAAGTERPAPPLLLFSPRVPVSAMVHCYLRGPRAALEACHAAAVAKSGIRLWSHLRGQGHPTLPDEPDFDNRAAEWSYFEWSMGPANTSVSDEAVERGWRAFFEERAAWQVKYEEDQKDQLLIDSASCVVS